MDVPTAAVLNEQWVATTVSGEECEVVPAAQRKEAPMSLHLADEMHRAGEQISRDAAELLSNAADANLHSLLPRITTASDTPWSVVLTGPYNAGKSSIALALTGDDSIVIDADVATAQTERYPWGGVEVVDTPGVRTGDLTHDEIAETALRNADLVLFVITPNLFRRPDR